MTGTARQLIIFDCDGVLVDSEPISIEVLVDALSAAGMPIDSEMVHRRFLGRSLGAVISTARDEYGLDINEAFLSAMRASLYDRFRAELEPMAGIAEAVEGLSRLNMDWCVASSSQKERIELSLTVTGLIDKFPNIYSATMVERGKPAPDLFLYAAREMGHDPSRCIVIEDSPAGVEAAKAAGMTVFAFTGGGHAKGAHYHQALLALNPDQTFDDMADLLHLVAKAGDRDGNQP